MDLTEICHTTRETLLDMSFTALGRSATILHTLTMAVRHLAENKLPAKITSTGSAPKSAGGRRPQRVSVAADLSLSLSLAGAMVLPEVSEYIRGSQARTATPYSSPLCAKNIRGRRSETESRMPKRTKKCLV